jgi:hypothetical protein
MYLAVLAIILGQALLFASWWTLICAGIVFVAVLLFVRLYEEPTLERTYGDEYRQYRSNVHGWSRARSRGAHPTDQARATARPRRRSSHRHPHTDPTPPEGRTLNGR